MPISKPFAIATEGPTIDGRNISREWIQQMAKSYDPKAYTAVVNLEHYISPVPESIFCAYGKVVSLGTQEAEILGEKKLQLTAIVDVPQAAVDMQKAGKKAFSSMEIQQNFIGRGITYLTGLALTDTPASLGTEPMKFSAFSGKEKDAVFAFASELGIEFEPEGKEPSAGESLFSKVKDLLGLGKKDTDARFSDQGLAIETIATSQKETLDTVAGVKKDFTAMQSTTQATADALKKLGEDFAAFQAKIDKTPNGNPQRPPATGGNGLVKTDC